MKIVIHHEDGIVAGVYVLNPSATCAPEIILVDVDDGEEASGTLILEPIEDAPAIVRKAIS